MHAIPFGVVAILFLVIVAPIWIVAHYGTRWRTARMLSGEQERSLAELHELAQGLEERVENLERILDAEAPGWRDRHGGPPPGPGAGPWRTMERERHDERA
ncbi:MAG TPA: envelope stress response membrane protein PspB [Acetobacteraceae bacterium]|nr:envelope stress response membrane protein PspB [Acetobacteraceae bacterium]